MFKKWIPTITGLAIGLLFLMIDQFRFGGYCSDGPCGPPRIITSTIAFFLPLIIGVILSIRKKEIF